MLGELINLIKPHKEDHPKLYEYLMITWTACHYNSTLYACNIDGAICLQQHLREFEQDIIEYYQKENNKGFQSYKRELK
jgi:hypothetical protein